MDGLKAAVRVAKLKLPIKTDRQLNDILQHAADDLAEAYRIGAEEAQGEIVGRLRALATAKARREADHGPL